MFLVPERLPDKYYRFYVVKINQCPCHKHQFLRDRITDLNTSASSVQQTLTYLHRLSDEKSPFLDTTFDSADLGEKFVPLHELIHYPTPKGRKLP